MNKPIDYSQCAHLLGAGKALILKSGLAVWDARVGQFRGQHEPEFETYWQKEFDGTYGRYLAWVLFTVGAENVVKAAFVCNGIRPSGSTLKTLDWYCLQVKKLQVTVSWTDQQTAQVEQGCKELKKVRDRDAHSYVANVRIANFPLVAERLVPMLNLLVCSMGI